MQVGSASGNSAAVWGKELRQNEGVLVAFDTWNGDLDMWLSESFRDVMGWQVCCPVPALSAACRSLQLHLRAFRTLSFADSGKGLVQHQHDQHSWQLWDLHPSEQAPFTQSPHVNALSRLRYMLPPAHAEAIWAACNPCNETASMFFCARASANGNLICMLQDGHSHLYERFLNRMIKESLTDTVLPVRTTAPVGARMMGVLNYTVDAIYLDAAQVRPCLPFLPAQ